MTRTAALALMILAASGCVTPRATLRELPDAELTTVEQVRPHLYRPSFFSWLFVFVLADSLEDADDPNCPVRTEIGNTVAWVGGCTDGTGNVWSGSRLARVGPRGASITFREYGSLEESVHGHARTSNGRLSIALRFEDEDGRHVVLFEERRPRELPIDGEEDENGPTVWSGTGSLGSDEHGKVDFEIHAFGDRSVCKTEPLSGSTRLYADGHTVEVIYDGATDCDPEGLATWTLDGVPMGEIDIPNCSVNSSTPEWAWLLLLIPLAVRRRRDPAP